MASRRLTTKSGRPVDRQGAAVVALFKTRARKAAVAASSHWLRKAQALLSQRGHGKRVPSTGHVRSAPGEPPARDTGGLVASLGIRELGDGHWRWGSGSRVGLFTDRGTRNMAPRPWVVPSINASIPGIRVEIRRVMAGG